ncbi:hypothetical protein [Sphingomonas sp. SAFR-052]|uniref:hypothetical protein n=1 Tax=Sphingomonas sp. SAFR-052 TaxID=3436867 RepID=UPI003F81CADA
MARLAIVALGLAGGFVLALAGGSRLAAAQELSYFYCYAPDPAKGVTYVSSVNRVGPVAERSRYGAEFVTHLKLRGLGGTAGYCTMRATMREIDRGRSEMAQMTCLECTGAERLEDVEWLRGGEAPIQSVLVSKQGGETVSDSVSTTQAATDAAPRDAKLLLSAAEAGPVLDFFFGSVPGAIDDNDRRFAQALIVDSARASVRMSYAETLLRSAISPAATPSGVIRAIARRVLTDLAEPDSVRAAFEGDHSAAVVAEIRRRWKSVWTDRVQQDDSSMLP